MLVYGSSRNLLILVLRLARKTETVNRGGEEAEREGEREEVVRGQWRGGGGGRWAGNR